MAAENAASDQAALRSASGYLAAPILSAAVGAAILWWRGEEMTLGHIIAMLAGAGVIALAVWLRTRRDVPE